MLGRYFVPRLTVTQALGKASAHATGEDNTRNAELGGAQVEFNFLS